jgi:bacillopeptidase F (M6 metalloprotease family)
VYYTSFEGTCPDGWTLTGDWQCGVPTNPAGPPTAYDGTQCIGVGMVQDYSDDDTWAGTTATSPPIDLTGATSPTLTFRMWVDTEGSSDGANLEVSTDGGATYSVVGGVTPAYTATIGGEPAWSGQQAALGWQLVQADLTPYSGMTIRLRFGFQSDATVTYPGVYVDDFLVE